MHNLFYRPVQDTDAPFLSHLMNQPSLLQRLHQLPTTKKDWDEAIFLWLRDPDETGYILLFDQMPIGWFAFNGLMGEIPYLKIAVLLPDFQGRGIGSRILIQLLQQLKRDGYSSVRLFADQDNLPALACYRKCGFRVLGTSEESWPDGSTILQYEMEKRF